MSFPGPFNLASGGFLAAPSLTSNSSIICPLELREGHGGWSLAYKKWGKERGLHAQAPLDFTTKACSMLRRAEKHYSCHVFAILILVLFKSSFSVRKSLLLAKLQEYYCIKWNNLSPKDFLIWKAGRHRLYISWREISINVHFTLLLHDFLRRCLKSFLSCSIPLYNSKFQTTFAMHPSLTRLCCREFSTGNTFIPLLREITVWIFQKLTTTYSLKIKV